MKRKFEEEEVAEGIPKDVISVLVHFVDVQQVRKIASLLGVSKTFYAQKEVFLKRWAEFVITKIDLRKQPEEIEYLHGWMCKQTGDTEWFLPLLRRESIEEYAHTLFDAQKYAILHDVWLGHDERNYITPYDNDCKEELGNLFFHDPVTNTVLPLICLPGLSVMKEKGEDIMKKELKEWLSSDKNDVKGEMASKRVSGLSTRQLSVYHYNIQKELGVKTDELPPSHDSLLIHTILDGKPLFMKTLPNTELIKNLYYCKIPRELSCRNHAQCRANLVAHWLDYKQGKKTIIDRLGLPRPTIKEKKKDDDDRRNNFKERMTSGGSTISMDRFFKRYNDRIYDYL